VGVSSMSWSVAVVGAGPSGLFAAQSLIRKRPDIHIDIYDRLPTPFGLLRYGVAPDHTSIKSVAVALARTFEAEQVHFRGLVHFGKDVTRNDLLGAYDAVIYAVGASEDLRLNILGEELIGSTSAREFVAWYSGHPDARDYGLTGVTSVMAVGVGNVAVDVARILAKDARALDSTDMPETVLGELRRAAVRDIWLVGRRGAQHAKFTPVELRELLKTPGLAVDCDPADLDGIDEDHLDRRTSTNLSLLREAQSGAFDGEVRCTLHLRFWRRPLELRGDSEVESVVLGGTRLDDDGRVVDSGLREEIPTDLVLRAIGYRSVPLPGVSFDADRGIVPNSEGRVLTPDGAICPREYVVGWIKRGPIGVIGTNKSDANQTVTHLLADLDPNSSVSTVESRRRLSDTLAARGVSPSSFDDWKRIEKAETNLGMQHERDRTKIETWHELLDLCRSR